MKYTTRWTVDAQAELRGIELPVARRILAKLTELEADPFGFDTTALIGQPDVRRLRVGDWRVFSRVQNDELIVLVVSIGHRSEVYEQ